jgi:hypothetical protein
MPSKITSTLDKAYGNIPKEVAVNFTPDIIIFRGFKFYWLKFLRKLKGR